MQESSMVEVLNREHDFFVNIYLKILNVRIS